MHEGLTLGTPLAMLVRNQDMRSGDYEEMRTKFRPSHADYTYKAKYGIRAWQGGGRASARETVGRVAAGAVARKVLRRVGGRTSTSSPGSSAWPDLEAAVDAGHRHDAPRSTPTSRAAPTRRRRNR